MAIKTKAPKILIWDIESTGLRATFATILCIGWKWHGQKHIHVPTILGGGTDMLDDKQLVEEFAGVLAECDYHVTWYGDRFDKKMIQAKLIRYGLAPLAPKPSLDLWRTARRHFNLHSNRLAVWQQYLNVQYEKTAIDFDVWRQAGMGNKTAIKEVVRHCKLDVLVLEEVFNKMRPWIAEEPARKLFNPAELPFACISCGSTHLTKQGFKVARTRRYQQWKCQGCGKWQRSRTSERAGVPALQGTE